MSLSGDTSEKEGGGKEKPWAKLNSERKRKRGKQEEKKKVGKTGHRGKGKGGMVSSVNGKKIANTGGKGEEDPTGLWREKKWGGGAKRREEGNFSRRRASGTRTGRGKEGAGEKRKKT